MRRVLRDRCRRNCCAVSLYFLSIAYGPDAALPLDDWRIAQLTGV